MSTSLPKNLKRELEDAIDDVTVTLRRAVEDLSEDAETAASQASLALRKAAQDLADRAPPTMRAVASGALCAAKAHPRVTMVTAFAAVAGVLAAIGLRQRTRVR